MKKFWSILAILVCLPVFEAQAMEDVEIVSTKFKNYEEFRELVKNLSQEDKNQVLSSAIEICNAKLVEAALQGGADANKEIPSYCSKEKAQCSTNTSLPLLKVIMKCHFDTDITIRLSKILLRNGADINAIEPIDENAFKIALRYEKNDEKHRLLIELLKHIPSEGLNPEIATYLVANAQIEGRQDLLELYRKYTLKVSAKTREAGNALIKVVDSEYPAKSEFVRNLIAGGVDVNHINKNAGGGMTPLISAIELPKSTVHAVSEAKDKPQADIEIVKLLVDNGADVNLSLKDGASPLYYAVVNNYYEIAELLLEHGADVNAKFKLQIRNDYETAKFIWEHIHSNFETEPKFGTTVLQIAKEKGYTGIADLLRQYGAKEPTPQP